MEPIRNFDQLTSHLKTLNKRKRIAVVCANDPNTEYAIARALDEAHCRISDDRRFGHFGEISYFKEISRICADVAY